MSKIERVFLGKSQPILGEIADRLLGLATRPSAGGPLDLRDYLVILPGRRACRLLLRELSTRCHSSSQSLIPPQIETFVNTRDDKMITRNQQNRTQD